MWKRIVMARLMAEATGGDGGAAGGAAAPADQGAVDPAAAAAAATPPADPAASTTPPPTAKPASALQAGQPGEPTALDFIPEKYRVNKDDGTFDMDASARKLAEAHGHLEKRMGAGDLPPKDASEYKITVPDTMGEYKPTEDPTMTTFLGDAQKAGMTQAQIDVVMDHYFKAAPQLAGAGAAFNQEQATTTLKEVWKTEGDFKRNTGLAFQATSAAIERAGVSMEEVERTGLGNNPVFLRLMAGLGAEFQEDKSPQGASFQKVGEQDIKTMEASPAYSDPKHPDHDRVTSQIKAFYDRKYGTEAAG